MLKSEQIKPKDILKEVIKRDTLYKTSNFLITMKIQFNNILEFIKNPINYPGEYQKIKLIIRKFLNDAISEHLQEIRALNLHIKSIEREIMNTLFKGGKSSGNPGSPQYLKSNQKINNKEV